MSQTDVPTQQTLTNSTQVQVGASSMVALVAGYAYGHGWLSLSLTDWTTIVTALVTIGPILWPIIKTRAQALKDQTGKLKNTTVVTDKASAEALPNNKDVVASTPAIVAAISKAQ